MRVEQTAPKRIKVVQGRPVTEVLRRAVHQALLEHKRAGNTIAAWENGRVVLIPAEEIQVEDESNPDVLASDLQE